MAIDGVMLDIPETDANLANYPKASGGTRRPYPQVRIVGLGESGTHALLAARIGSIHDGERELAAPLAANVGPDMLVTADRGFFSFPLWRTFLLTGAALLWRVTATVQLPVLQALPDGSYLSEINRVRGGRARILLGSVADPHLATHIPVRVIEYRVDTGSIPAMAPARNSSGLSPRSSIQPRWTLTHWQIATISAGSSSPPCVRSNASCSSPAARYAPRPPR